MALRGKCTEVRKVYTETDDRDSFWAYHYLDASWISSSELGGETLLEDPDGISANTSIRFHKPEYS